MSMEGKSQIENNNLIHIYSKSDYARLAKEKNREARLCRNCENNKEGYCNYYKGWCDKARRICKFIK